MLIFDFEDMKNVFFKFPTPKTTALLANLWEYLSYMVTFGEFR